MYIYTQTQALHICTSRYDDPKWGSSFDISPAVSVSSYINVCVCVYAHRCACVCVYLHCLEELLSYDRPSVCRCSSSSSNRSGGVPGEAAKSSQGSGGGEPRLSESFSMFIHPALLLLFWQHNLRQPQSTFKCRENSLTPTL